MKKIPQHLGIILDGNRRWAKEKGLPVFEGHQNGLKNIIKIGKLCKEEGVKILTLFVFSTENWNRPKKEVDYLMNLIKTGLNKDLRKLSEDGIKIRVIGQKEMIPASVQKAILKIEELTKNNKKMVVNIAFSYGGRAEIVEAIKNIIKNKIPPEKITEDTIKNNLWTSDVDLIIRTGKEKRISNFLIWQAAYSELYFSNKYWPDFNEKELEEAFVDYASRQRRFGK